MKNIIKDIINGLVYAKLFTNDEKKDLLFNEALHIFQEDARYQFYKNWKVNKQSTQTMGISIGSWDTQFNEEDRNTNKESNYLLFSLPLVLEHLHLTGNQLEESVFKYHSTFRLHLHTYIVMETMHIFMYELLFYKDKERAYKRMANASLLSGDKKFPLRKMFNKGFLKEDLHEHKKSNHPADLWILIVQSFMNTNSTNDALEMAFKTYDLNATGMLVLGAIANMYYQDVPQLDVPTINRKMEETLKAFEMDYSENFEFLSFTNPIEKYTINELNRMKYIMEGQNPEEYVFDPKLEKFLEDEDQAHDDDYSLSLLLAELAWGIKVGYIDENSHVLDLHKYRFNPDSLKHAENDIDDEGFLDMYTIHNLNLMFHLSSFTPYVK